MGRHWCYLIIGMLLVGTPAAAAGVQFSAEMVQKTEGTTQSMRYYQGDQKVRTEVRDDDGRLVASIIDFRERKLFQVIDEEKAYMELPLGGEFAAWAADPATQDELFEVKKAGTETVSGYTCDRYEMIPKKKGVEKTTTWVARKLGCPIKTVSASHSMELTNIVEGVQAASLFAVPRGYQKLPGLEDYYREMMDEGVGEEPEPEGRHGAPGLIYREARDVGDEVRGEAKGAIKEELSDSVRKGIRKLFGRE